jgi:hypothetical protein
MREDTFGASMKIVVTGSNAVIVIPEKLGLLVKSEKDTCKLFGRIWRNR